MPRGPFVSKQRAAYRRSKGRETCGNCRHFKPQKESCDIVKGEIRPEFVCNLWGPDERISRSNRGDKVVRRSATGDVLRATEVGVVGAVGVTAVSAVGRGIT